MFQVWCSRFQFFHGETLAAAELEHDGETYRRECDFFIYIA